jgi:hypothetical protein
MRKWKFHCLGEVGADCWKAGLPHWHAGVLARGNSDRKTLDHRLASELCQPYKPIALFVTDSALLHIYVHMRDFSVRKWRYPALQNLPLYCPRVRCLLRLKRLCFEYIHKYIVLLGNLSDRGMSFAVAAPLGSPRTSLKSSGRRLRIRTLANLNSTLSSQVSHPF